MKKRCSRCLCLTSVLMQLPVAVSAHGERGEIIFYEDGFPRFVQDMEGLLMPFWKDAVAFCAALCCLLLTLHISGRRKSRK